MTTMLTFVERSRFCARCGKQIQRHHKYQWHPLPEVGIYRLEHRDCAEPESYSWSKPKEVTDVPSSSA